MKLKMLAVGVGLFATALTLPVGAASAGPGGTKGPGDCNGSPGEVVRFAARAFDGANAGPKADVNWHNPPGKPNTPGQAVQFDCLS